MSPLRRSGKLTWPALAAFGGNLLGVLLLLGRSPNAYRIESVKHWGREIALAPGITVASSLAFIVGLVAMAYVFWEISRENTAKKRERLELGAHLALVGALLNAVGCLLPLTVAFVGTREWTTHVLQLAIFTDAAFNLTLGLGLLLWASATARRGVSRPRRAGWPTHTTRGAAGRQ